MRRCCKPEAAAFGLYPCPLQPYLSFQATVQECTNALKGATSRAVHDAIRELVQGGHLYSTIDDDHYMPTFGLVFESATLVAELRTAIASMRPTAIRDALEKVPEVLRDALPMVNTARALLRDIELFEAGGCEFKLPDEPHSLSIRWKNAPRGATELRGPVLKFFQSCDERSEIGAAVDECTNAMRTRVGSSERVREAVRWAILGLVEDGRLRRRFGDGRHSQVFWAF